MEISPCKCGSKAEFVKTSESKRYDGFVRCTQCGAEGRGYASKQMAVAAWNKAMAPDDAYDKALKELVDIDTFCHMACTACNSEAYCPTDCATLEKARKLPFENIVKCYTRNEGDWAKVFRYIKRTKEA